MKAEKYEFHNGNNSVYFLGNYDKNSHIFEKEEPHTIDYGLDFYAPQTTLLPDGRRVMIAWMKSWDACVVPDTQDWQGMMTLPRELEVKDGQIWQQPVRELAQYHKNPCHYEHAEIDGETALSGICGRTMDLTITMDEQDFNVFSIQLAADEEYETAFTYHKGTGILEIDRTYCGVTKDVVCVRKIKIADPKGLKKCGLFWTVSPLSFLSMTGSRWQQRRSVPLEQERESGFSAIKRCILRSKSMILYYKK